MQGLSCPVTRVRTPESRFRNSGTDRDCLAHKNLSATSNFCLIRRQFVRIGRAPGKIGSPTDSGEGFERFAMVRHVLGATLSAWLVASGACALCGAGVRAPAHGIPAVAMRLRRPAPLMSASTAGPDPFNEVN